MRSKLVRTERYDRGRYTLHPDASLQGPLREFIQQHRFHDVAGATNIQSRNRQHRVYSFHFDGLRKDVIVKVYWVNPAYSLRRRTERRISLLLKDRARRAFVAALDLQDNEIDTFTPMATWSYRKRTGLVEHYLMYERIPAKGRLEEYINRLDAGNPKTDPETESRLIQSSAELVARMHRKRFLHGDLATINFLVLETNGVAVIDLDRVTRNRLPTTLLRKLYCLWSLRSVSLPVPQSRLFLEAYLGPEFSEPRWRLARCFRHIKRRRYARAAQVLIAGEQV